MGRQPTERDSDVKQFLAAIDAVGEVLGQMARAVDHGHVLPLVDNATARHEVTIEREIGGRRRRVTMSLALCTAEDPAASKSSGKKAKGKTA